MDILSNLMGGSGNFGNRGYDDHRGNTYEKFDYEEPVTIDGYRVCAIMLTETGTYNPEFLRPYTVSVDRGDVYNIADIASENGQALLRPENIAGVAGRILRYSSQVDKHDLVDIENGWDVRRLSFLIEVVEESRTDFDLRGDMETVTYISGFTDRLDVVETRNGRYGDFAPAPDLKFYVTNIYRIERETRRIHSNFQLLVPSHHGVGRYDRQRDNLYTIRPRDVFNDGVVREKTPIGSKSFNQSNQLIGTLPKSSRTSNLSPSTYMASSINALISSETQRGSGSDEYGSYDPTRRRGADVVYSTAAGKLNEEPPLPYNSFTYLLKSKTNEFGSRSIFSWADLEDIFGPEIARVTSLYKRKTVERNRRNSRWAAAGESSNWDNNENEGYNAVFATALKQTLPGYALESMIYSCRIEATNIVDHSDSFDTIAGALITISNVVFIARMPSAQQEEFLIDEFRQKIANYVLRDTSLNNQVPYDVVVELDWRGDSFIWVGIDGGEMIDFSTASFSNALTPPIITTNQDFSEDMMTDLKQVVGEILARGY